MLCVFRSVCLATRRPNGKSRKLDEIRKTTHDNESDKMYSAIHRLCTHDVGDDDDDDDDLLLHVH